MFRLYGARTVHPVAVVQSEYSLWTRDVEAEILPACRDLGVGFVAYSPLGRGFLTGSFQQEIMFDDGDFRAKLPRFQTNNIVKNRLLVELITTLAVRKSCTTAQIALAWLLAQGEDIVPIPGTRRINHLHENLGSLSVHLDSEDHAEINRAIDTAPVIGERYTKEGMKGINA